MVLTEKREVAFLSATMIAVGGYHVFLSQECRHYTWLAVVGTLGVIAFIRFMRQGTWIWLAAFTCSLLAGILSHYNMFFFLMGRPACRAFGEAGADGIRGFYTLAAEGSERAVVLLLFVVLFLGYPWEGWVWLLAWSGAAFGTALLSAAARAVLEGRDMVTLRRLQGAAALFALLSLALVFVAVV